MIFGWLAVTVAYAWWFVTVDPPRDFVGYERDWDFRLLVFAMVRLPPLLLGLALAFWLVGKRTSG